MRIALIGAGGQLAADLVTALSPGHEVVGFLRPGFELCRPESIAESLDPHDWDMVLNTAAYNLVDQAETDTTDAFAVNAVGVGNLAKYCGRRGLPLVHFSTDYVFGLDGDRNRPWSEEDLPGPVSVYGNSKLAGEFAVRGNASEHLVIRTCGLYGRKGSRGKGGNFVETMLRLADQGKTLRIVGDQCCTPSFTADVAVATRALIEAGARGVVNVTNSGSCSWFEFAQAIFRLAGKEVSCERISSAEFGAQARRPPYSVLSLSRLEELSGGATPPDWSDALRRYLLGRSTPTS